MLKIIYTIESINDVAKELITNLSSKIVLVYGEMGVGKTTLIKALVKQLGSTDDANSPTFSIVNEYKATDSLIYHFDLYRIKNIEEAYNFGIEDYLFSDNWSIIEWPEKIENIVPIRFDRIDLELNSNSSRTLKLNHKKEFNITKHAE